MTASSTTTGTDLQQLLSTAPTQPAPAPAALDWEQLQIERAQAGDATAFRCLVERYQSRLLRFCQHTLTCPQDAQEICQDAFVKAWLALPDYTHCGHFQAWLFRIALNQCRDHTRSRHHSRRRATLPLDPALGETLVCQQPTPDTTSALRCEIDRLHRGIATLPDRLRLPLILCSLEQLSQEECGHVLGLSVRAVEGRLHRARKQLLQWWETAT